MENLYLALVSKKFQVSKLVYRNSVYCNYKELGDKTQNYKRLLTFLKLDVINIKQRRN